MLDRQSQREEQQRTSRDQNQVLPQTTVAQIPALMRALDRVAHQQRQAAGRSPTLVDAR